MNIFVDTGAFYALADKSDKFHDSAKQYFMGATARDKFFTSYFVFVESWTLIHHKLGKQAAHQFWQSVRQEVVTLIEIVPLDLEAAWKISDRYDDQNFSLVDCTSFAVMERLKIVDAFAFDKHFAIYRSSAGQPLIVHPQ